MQTNRPLRRVAICQRYLAHYRVAAMDELAALLADRGYELRYFFSFFMGKPSSAPWQRKLFGIKREMKMGEVTEAAVLSPTLFWQLLRYRPDVLVLEDVSSLLNTTMAAAYGRIFRRPYLIWGLGRIPGKQPSWPRRFLAPLISWLHRHASGFICYSTWAQKSYGVTGKPTFLALNACLPRPDSTAAARIKKAIAERTLSSVLRLISIGVLKRQKRYHVLLDAMALLQDSPVELDIIGDGPERAALEQQARLLRIDNRIRFRGALYEGTEKESLLLGAQLGVLPGRGGLAIQEMLSYGVPVVSGVADGTEGDLIHDGETGYLLRGGPGAADLAAAIRSYSALTPTDRERMSVAAFDFVAGHANNELLAASIVNAIEQTDRAHAPLMAAGATG
jgi:glycosyltransferase involved in cell wall biosynthesis